MARADLKRRLHVHIGLDRAVSDATENLGKTPSRSVSCRILRRKRRTLRHSHVDAGPDQRDHDRRAKGF